jgi:hypothetical protein
MMWLPRSRCISATPLIARLFDSVEPLGEHDLLGGRADQLGDLLARPIDGLLRLPAERVVATRGVAELRVKYGNIASRPSGRSAVVAWLSR